MKEWIVTFEGFTVTVYADTKEAAVFAARNRMYVVIEDADDEDFTVEEEES